MIERPAYLPEGSRQLGIIRIADDLLLAMLRGFPIGHTCTGNTLPGDAKIVGVNQYDDGSNTIALVLESSEFVWVEPGCKIPEVSSPIFRKIVSEEERECGERRQCQSLKVDPWKIVVSDT